jgi:hypothetical protein
VYVREIITDKEVTILFLSDRTVEAIFKDKVKILISDIKEYVENATVIYTHYNQIKQQEKMLAPQIKYLEIENNILKLKDLVSKDDIYLETIRVHL